MLGHSEGKRTVAAVVAAVGVVVAVVGVVVVVVGVVVVVVVAAAAAVVDNVVAVGDDWVEGKCCPGCSCDCGGLEHMAMNLGGLLEMP